MADKNSNDFDKLSEEDIDLLNIEELENAFGNIMQAGESFLIAKGECLCSKTWDYCI